MVSLIARIAALLQLGVTLAACSTAIVGADDTPTYDAFKASGCVQIEGFDDHTMEPFVTSDGQTLMFNNANAPPEHTDLHWARRIDETHFLYAGTIEGANSSGLDAVASVDSNGRFYFVSTRSYERTLSTLYEAQWLHGRVTGVRLVEGVSRHVAGWLNFDAEISSDGATLYFVDGRFSGGAVPDEADLVIAHKSSGAFERDPASARLLASINTAALEYAPSISQDGLELFFTRLDMSKHAIGIYRTTRRTMEDAFGVASRVSAANGFVEAPTLSSDGATLFFHRLDGGHFEICRLTRQLHSARQPPTKGRV